MCSCVEDPDIQTQDPMIAPNNGGGGGGANGGAGGGAGAGGGDNGVPDDPDGNDTPIGLSAFNDPNFDPIPSRTTKQLSLHSTLMKLFFVLL